MVHVGRTIRCDVGWVGPLGLLAEECAWTVARQVQALMKVATFLALPTALGQVCSVGCCWLGVLAWPAAV